MNTKIRLQLSAMMFLQFFIWGIWFVTMGTYLAKIGFRGVEIGNAYSTMNWGGVLAPLFVGMIADRFFSAEKVLGILHLVGGAMLYAASRMTLPGPFFWALLCYALLYVPTLTLVNAISFHQMKDPGAQFPGIRVLGTIGWIAAGILVGKILKRWNPDIEAMATPMVIGAAVSIVMGLYSFTLPATPAKSQGKRVTVKDVLGLDALALMKNRSYATLVISSLLISIPLSFYYNFTNLFLNETKGVSDPAFTMTFGQMSEIVFLVSMPVFFRRLGVKKLMLVGMLAWTVRYVLFAKGAGGAAPAMLYLGIILHGVCFDFFFVTGQIYVDRKAPKELQASAQGLIGMATYGVGMLIGARVSGVIIDAYKQEGGGHRWGEMWFVPAVMAAVVTVLFALLFKDDTAPAAATATEPARAGAA